MNRKTDKAAQKKVRDQRRKTCPICQQAFMSRSQKTDHMRLTHNQRPVKPIVPAAELYGES